MPAESETKRGQLSGLRLTRPGVAPAQGRARPDANAYACTADRSLPDARDSVLLRAAGCRLPPSPSVRPPARRLRLRLA